MGEGDLSALFDQVFSKPSASVEGRALLSAMGEEYPAGLDTYSWASRSELRKVADNALSIGAQHVVDLGCGRGGPGLWVAKATRARLTGLDVAESALAQAREQARRAGIEASFVQGAFEDTRLPSSVADVVVSFDAFLFTPDKTAAFAEIARILRPGGLLALTSWDYHTQPRNRPPQIDDHRPLAGAAGFSVLEYGETSDWRGRCVRFAEFMLENVEEAAAEAGVPVEEMRSGVLDMRASMDCMSRRFLMIATRNDE